MVKRNFAETYDVPLLERVHFVEKLRLDHFWRNFTAVWAFRCRSGGGGGGGGDVDRFGELAQCLDLILFKCRPVGGQQCGERAHLFGAPGRPIALLVFGGCGAGFVDSGGGGDHGNSDRFFSDDYLDARIAATVVGAAADRWWFRVRAHEAADCCAYRRCVSINGASRRAPTICLSVCIRDRTFEPTRFWSKSWS